MTKDPAQNYQRALGARILSEANDLKRTPEALAAELGLEESLVRSVIAGEAAVETIRGVMRAMTEKYPVALDALWLEPDDTDHGVRIMRAADSRATSRTFSRKDRSGVVSPYYEYRDTATSRTGPFKPEWIQPLRVVGDADPDNPDVAYNHGHLLHQATFFIGPVNFYWRAAGRSFCVELNTGDSNYITPFVPHSFTSRDPKQLGLIIAVTYAGEVRRALNDMARTDPEVLDPFVGDLRDASRVFSTRLRRYLAAESMSEDTLAARLQEEGVETTRAARLASGTAAPSPDELRLVANLLTVRPQDLMASALRPEEEVVVVRSGERGMRLWPDSNRPTCRLVELARTRHQAGLKGFDVAVVGDRAEGSAPFRHGLYEYVYNYGEAPITIWWNGDHEAILESGDSAVVQPFVEHGYARRTGSDGKLALVRVPGSLNDAAMDEFAAFALENRDRALRETGQWF